MAKQRRTNKHGLRIVLPDGKATIAPSPKRCASSADALAIYIYDIIGEDFWGDGVTPKSIISQLEGHQEGAPVDVFINSPGGSVFDGTTIYNILARWAGRVDVYIDGLAASAASLIAMAGESIHIADNALMMIHNPWSLVVGDANDMRKEAAALDKITQTYVDTYIAKTGQTEDAVRAFMAAETWFDADSAVENGFATDKVEAQSIAAMAVPGLCVPPENMAAKLSAGRVAGGTQLPEPETMSETKTETPKGEAKPNTPDESSEGVRNATSGTGEPLKSQTTSASLEDLRKALPKADAEFLVKAIDNQWTVERAVTEYAASLETKLAEANERAAELEKTGKESRTPGNQPVSAGGKPKERPNSDCPIEEFNGLVAAKVKNGMKHHEATREVSRDDPDLRERYVAAWNKKHQNRRTRQ